MPSKAFGEDINPFHNNRDCVFVPISSESHSNTSQAFDTTFHVPFVHHPDSHGNDHDKSHGSDRSSSPDACHQDLAFQQITSVCGVSLRSIDGLSAMVSAFLFVVACGFASDSAKYVDLWDQVLVVHNSTQLEHISDSFTMQVKQWCFDMPRIPQLTAYGFPALPVIVNDFEVNLWLLNIPIFFISATFQGYRYVAAKKPVLGFGQYNPTMGPDVGRWIEYMLTSPLQVVIVAIAYHIRDESQLVSLAFLQAMLVFTGYCIEREAFWWQTGMYKYKFEYNALLILVGLSWLVHFIIWFRIIMFRWLSEVQVMDQCSAKTFGPGRGDTGEHTHWTTKTSATGNVLTVDAYGLTHDSVHHGNAGARDEAMDWKSQKVIIDLMFASQFIFFTLFGIVNLLTLKSIRHDDSEGKAGDIRSIRYVWGTATKRYSILSIVVKTLLEIFFFVYVLTNPSGIK